MASMKDSLIQAFACVLSPDAQQRAMGEAVLSQLQESPGYLSCLFQLTANDGDLTLRQQAGVQMKNAVRDMWAPRKYDRDLDKYVPLPSKITENERNIVRENLLTAMIAAPHVIRTQFGVMMHHVVDADFPERYPNLLPSIKQLLETQDYNSIYSALYALRIIVKKYEFKPTGKGREPLIIVVNETFPRVFELFNGLVHNQTIEAASAMTLICKTFFACTHLEMPPMLRNPQVLMPWMTNFAQLFTCPLPPGQPEDLDERKAWPWWIAKKWSIQIFTRLFSAYSEPQNEDDAEQVAFSNMFMNTYVNRILEAVLQVVSTVADGQGYLPEKVKTLALQYLDQCLRFASTYKALKGHLQQLLRHVIFPMVQFNEQDKECWETDPHEYIRKEYDVVEEYFSSKKTAETFMFNLFKLRSKQNLIPFMQFIVEHLMRYQAAPPEQKDVRAKDGALSTIGTLSQQLKLDPIFAGGLEDLLLIHVIPDLQSPVPFLRSKACWCFSVFFDLDMQDATFLRALESTVNCLRDPELPVRVSSAVAFRFLLHNNLAIEALKPNLGHILDQFFDLMQLVDNDELIGALEKVIDTYEDDIGPYAVGVCQRLAEAFVRIAGRGESNETSALAALECLKAIQTVLASIRNHPDLYGGVEQVILPMLLNSLNPNFLEYFEDLLKIITFITFFSENISESMWQVVPVYQQNVQSWADDYLPNMLPSLDNLISKSTNIFVSSPAPALVYKMVERCMTKQNAQILVHSAACQLIECMLQNCPGQMDQFVPGFLEMMVTRLQQPLTSKSLRILIFNVFANVLYYNPILFFNVCEKQGWTMSIFQGWFDVVKDYSRIYDRKLAVLGMSAMYSVPPAQLPVHVQALLQPLLVIQLKLMHDAHGLRQLQEEQERKYLEKKQRVKAQRKAQGFAVEEEDSDEYDISEEENEAQFKNSLLDGSLSSLAMQEINADGSPASANVGSDEDIGVDLGEQEYLEAWLHQLGGEDDDELEDEDDVSTPIDTVDEILFFCQRMHEFPGAQQLAGLLAPAEQSALQQITVIAETKKVQQQQQQQQQ